MKKTDNKRGGFDRIAAKMPKKTNEPKAVKSAAKQDLRVKGG